MHLQFALLSKEATCMHDKWNSAPEFVPHLYKRTLPQRPLRCIALSDRGIG
jgi:hypothetical protein